MTTKTKSVVLPAVVSALLMFGGLACGGVKDAAGYQKAAGTPIHELPALAKAAVDAQFGAGGSEMSPMVVVLMRAVHNQIVGLRAIEVKEPTLRAAHEDYLAACVAYHETIAAVMDRIIFAPVGETKQRIHAATERHAEAAAVWLQAVGAEAP